MNIGILGTGFGSYHAELYTKRTDIDEIYVFGRNEKKLEELKNKLGVKTTTNIVDIIENPDIDLIDICLPNPLHKQYAIIALEHGKHVFCETPISVTMDDAIAMQQAKEKSNKQLMIDLFLRFEGPYQLIADYAKNYNYGKIKKLHITRYTAPIWGDLGLDHITKNLMIHDIDFVTYLFGATDHIEVSKTSLDEKQCAVSAICTYDNAFAVIEASSMMPYAYPFSVSYEIIFEKAVIRFYEDSYQDRCDTKLTLFTADHVEDIQVDNTSSYENCIDHVLACITTSKLPKNDVSEAVKSLRMAETISMKLKNS